MVLPRRFAAQGSARGGETGANPTDRGKGGVKRSLLVGAQGLPIGIELDGANRHDMKRTDSTLAGQPPNVVAARQAWFAADVEQHLCLDAGYDYDEVRRIVAAHGYTAHIRPRGEEKKAKAAGQRARRWVVERTHSWLNRYRHLLIRWAKKPENYLALLHFSFAHLTGTVAYLDSLLVQALNLTLAIWNRTKNKNRNLPGRAGFALGNDTFLLRPLSPASFRPYYYLTRIYFAAAFSPTCRSCCWALSWPRANAPLLPRHALWVWASCRFGTSITGS